MKTLPERIMGFCFPQKRMTGFDIKTPFYLDITKMLVATNGYILFMMYGMSRSQVEEMYPNLNCNENRRVPNLTKLIQRMVMDAIPPIYRWDDLPPAENPNILCFGDYKYNPQQLKIISSFLGTKGRKSVKISILSDGMMRFEKDNFIILLNRLGHFPD